MGNTLPLVCKKEPVKILIVGLDGVGKTTILRKLKLGNAVEIKPIVDIEINIEVIKYTAMSFIIWDIKRQHKMWRDYFNGAQALIFVVDSNDRDRLSESTNKLHQLIRERQQPNNSIILIFANKQDLPTAMSISELTQKLNLNSLSTNKWFIQSTSAISGDNLYEGIDWLYRNLDI
eukprot:TRINITY_DN1673_c0_g1_i1.p1 TRINITY_DN1673_c0_g1~~TRINITY_DN1673_c0_g1_i1.p1  ORF type:complete len:176 (-),score=43.98 TRINITY_DN1673_c0_g1_i1:113-640(-)